MSLTNDVGNGAPGSAKASTVAKQVLCKLSYIPLLTCGFYVTIHVGHWPALPENNTELLSARRSAP